MALRWTKEQYDDFVSRVGNSIKVEKLDDAKEEKKSKYRNEKVNVDGITFDSQKEARYYNTLKILKRAGEVKDFILQPEFILFEGYIRKHDNKKIRPIKYIADFKVIWSDGRVEIVDVKSSKEFKTQVYRLKRKILEGRYPDIYLKEIYD
ncbi:DUF1064 domain-containing protein [Paenibacillus aestuarii]|uniref:DUF1064 domain-containing protein n=1 Tax=Paenibacillus aestuarii TaxID=516965 RepID=A0ABW0K6R0_9BACL